MAWRSPVPAPTPAPTRHKKSVMSTLSRRKSNLCGAIDPRLCSAEASLFADATPRGRLKERRHTGTEVDDAHEREDHAQVWDTDTREMMEFAHSHGLGAEIELIQPDEIETAWHRLHEGDVQYRFVIDLESLADS